MPAQKKFAASLRPLGTFLLAAIKKFSQIDGPQWAAAFAHYAFFSLFPLIILLVNIASAFVERDQARRQVLHYIESYVPINADMRSNVFDTIAGVINSRGTAGTIAFLILAWTAMRFFSTLIRATNRAWGAEAHQWWRLPLKSLLSLSILTVAVLFGIAAPVAAKMAREQLFPLDRLPWWLEATGGFSVPLVVVFFSLSSFYKLAPRRPTRFAEVWLGALCATALLRAAEDLFVIYLSRFASLNVMYGAFGGIMALLLWIYLCGCIFIFGACLCAAQAETLGIES